MQLYIVLELTEKTTVASRKKPTSTEMFSPFAFRTAMTATGCFGQLQKMNRDFALCILRYFA